MKIGKTTVQIRAGPPKYLKWRFKIMAKAKAKAKTKTVAKKTVTKKVEETKVEEENKTESASVNETPTPQPPPAPPVEVKKTNQTKTFKHAGVDIARKMADDFIAESGVEVISKTSSVNREVGRYEVVVTYLA
jgi:hypothetical protein